MSCFSRFMGNRPRAVGKDARYTIRTESGRPVVSLTYQTPHGERWLLTTEEHDGLVNIVNHIKKEAPEGGQPNGPFYLNEYGQVVVPVGRETVVCYLADEEYDRRLRFNFEGNIISGEAVDLHGQPLAPGDQWNGPHPGIRYVLTADSRDIRYTSEPRRNVLETVKLSDCVGSAAAERVAYQIAVVKGARGGRFYVNEWREMFAPLEDDQGIAYWYIGRLEEDTPWFPKRSP